MDPTKKELYTTKRTTGVTPIEDGSIDNILSILKNQNEKLNWILLKINTNKKIIIDSNGSNGLQEFLSYLNDNEIFYGILRIHLLNLNQIKFIHVTFLGSNINPIKKGQGILYQTSIQNLLDGHGILTLNGIEEATYENIYTKICQILKIQTFEM